ncbi:hypothetical protein PLESTB_001862400 [Pleodorina starrii]|uniref:Uncharacterized protein n=1 Tax=Pleodorina starrii TaxID=330485 RepID=A0A9W6FB14_9CHLO|nr:hypothetical protein PLESTB_001862400 [Pleodorina starrii]GLC70398.1 hypothetical protein PLESTF_000968700 [Pleodorina starrii]GLC77359.1 hypothetical protein PLESTF_001924600 [Pleodorina starrii]GLC77364.1 hypothetical protein PLESTF_001925100 [Pleodorina starrii]
MLATPKQTESIEQVSGVAHAPHRAVIQPSGAEPATAAAPCSAGGSRSSDHDGAGGQPPGASHGLHGSGSSTAAAAAEGTGDSRAAPFVMHGVLDHPGPVHGPETLSEMVDLMMARSER